MKKSAFLLSTILSAAVASPTAGTPTIREVSSVQESISLCTQYAYYSTAGYEILNNLWGKDTATSGNQCTYFDGNAGSGIKWSTQWTWNGAENNVKSYAYAGRILDKGNLVSRVKGMPTTISWKYDTTNMRCNVAYDIFTSTDPNHVNSSGDYELMIWYVDFTLSPQSDLDADISKRLGRFGGVWPISQAGAPIASVTIAGYKFDLYFGYNGSMKVYSFVTPTPNSPYTTFNADIKLFFDYLVQSQGYPASTQNLIGESCCNRADRCSTDEQQSVYQVGSEAFTGGPAKFTVDQFSASVNL
jgi:xyloglucan-specific endo-beta-1,4-glucanase